MGYYRRQKLARLVNHCQFILDSIPESHPARGYIEGRLNHYKDMYNDDYLEDFRMLDATRKDKPDFIEHM